MRNGPIGTGLEASPGYLRSRKEVKMSEIPPTLPDALERFSKVLERDLPRLRAMTEVQAQIPRAPEKWSPKQIIGHLIDSAANNHGRFVRGQLEQNSIYVPYSQNEWVELQNYGARGWEELLSFWEAYNRHLFHLIKTAQTPALEHIFQMPVGVPNAKTDGVSAVTVEFLMRDYVRHLEHHLAQIFSLSSA
jgi:hypothetical protein